MNGIPSRLVVMAAAQVAAALPLKAALGLGRSLGWMLGNVVRWRRTEAREALANAFPEQNTEWVEQVCNEMYANLGMNLIEMLRLLVRGPADLEGRVEVEGSENLELARRRDRGIIVLTAHLGNWDVLEIMAVETGLPLTVITKRIRNEGVNRVWQDSRRARGIRLVPAKESYRECLKALRRKELVGFMLDQNMIRDEGVFVEFFGRQACTTPGLAYMAAHSQAPILPVFSVRTGLGRHKIIVEPPLDPPDSRDEATILQATQQYTRIIEEVIREHPEQWIWVHRRWRTRPDAEKKRGE